MESMTNKIFKISFISIFSLFVFFSCKPDARQEKTERINELETSLFEEQKGIINKKEAANMIHAYIQYVDTFPGDTISPYYLFKAADVSINTFHSEQSIKLFNRLLNEYPNFSKAPQAIFLKAFTYENYLQQIDSAEVSYKLFLTKYPKHAFANDAKISLLNLGKSPEDIIRDFNSGE